MPSTIDRLSKLNSYWRLTLVPFLIRQKVYLDRARAYYGYAAFPSMIILVLRSFNVPLTAKFIAIAVPVFLIGSLLIGWVDRKLGLFSEEAKRHSSLNPIYTEIMDLIKEVKDDVNALRLHTILNLQEIKKKDAERAAIVKQMQESIKHIEDEVQFTKTILLNALKTPSK